MKFKYETKLDYFIIFLAFIKIIFILLAIGYLLLSFSIQQNKSHLLIKNKINTKLLYFKELTEYIFIGLIGILLIYQFNPYLPVSLITKDISFIFFLFGIFLLVTKTYLLIKHVMFTF